jgi:Arginase family
MEFDYLNPVSADLIDFVSNLSAQQLGKKITIHSEVVFPDLEKIKIAIVGVLENRGDKNQISKVDITPLRKEFYSLFAGNWTIGMADLGDIQAGETMQDTYFALQNITAYLIKNKIIPIVVGGSQDLTYPLYRAYDHLEQMVNLVAIDKIFDFGKEEELINKNSYLTKIVLEKPNNLFNFSNLGYQTHYNSQEEIDLIEKLFFDAYRFGDVSNNIAIAEPVLRSADLISIDLTAIKSSDSGNKTQFTPNGFTGKEICTLSRYAGISDKVSTLGIFNHCNTQQEFVLIAQIIWYFIEGINYRSDEYPFGSKKDYTKYIVPLEEELVFYKSDKTDRWWIEIPTFFKNNNKSKINALLPCSYEEYLNACNNEIPERWLKAQRKTMV